MLSQRFLISLMVWAGASLPASATLLTYSTQSSFNAATVGDTFQNISLAQGSFGTSMTDLATGVVFSDPLGLTGIAAPTGWPPGNALESTPGSVNTRTLTITLPMAVTAVEFLVGTQNFSNFNISASNTGGDTYSSDAFHQPYVSNPPPIFFGVTSSTPFSSVSIKTYSSVDHGTLESISVGDAETPETATLLMIGSGLLLLGLGHRWLPKGGVGLGKRAGDAHRQGAGVGAVAVLEHELG